MTNLMTNHMILLNTFLDYIEVINYYINRIFFYQFIVCLYICIFVKISNNN